MSRLQLLLSFSYFHVAAAADWQIKNNSNLKHGDITHDDFSLPQGIDESSSIAACTAFCANHTECAAWVYVRQSHRCAIKGTPVGVFQLKRIIVVYLQSSLPKNLPEIAPSRQHPSRRVRETGSVFLKLMI